MVAVTLEQMGQYFTIIVRLKTMIRVESLSTVSTLYNQASTEK